MTDNELNEDDPKIEFVAAAMWRDEAIRGGCPDSVVKGRTLYTFRDQSEELQYEWKRMALVAIEAYATARIFPPESFK